VGKGLGAERVNDASLSSAMRNRRNGDGFAMGVRRSIDDAGRAFGASEMDADLS
jgi:hypothetical protein